MRKNGLALVAMAMATGFGIKGRSEDLGHVVVADKAELREKRNAVIAALDSLEDREWPGATEGTKDDEVITLSLTVVGDPNEGRFRTEYDVRWTFTLSVWKVLKPILSDMFQDIGFSAS